MSEWKEVKLNDVCELIVDCPHSTAPDEGHGYPLIRTPNIGKGRLILDGVHRVSKDIFDTRNARAVPKPYDLIFAREATAGNVAQIQEGQEVCLGQRTVLIRPNQSIVDSSFLTYLLLAPLQQHNLVSSANGATVAHVNLPTIRNLKISIPELPLQKKLGSILASYDNLIENYQRQIKLLEEAAQRLYKEWFVDLHFPGYENTKIVDGVPEGWRKGTLSSISEFRRGKTITKKEIKEGTVPVVAGGLTPAYYTNTSNTGSRVITISASGANAGYTRLYYQNIWASDCSFVDASMTKYLYYVYCFLKVNKSLIDNLQKGAAQPHVYPKDINALEIIIPSQKILDSTEEILSSMFEEISQIDAQIHLLIEARDRLLPKLMSGEIEV